MRVKRMLERRPAPLERMPNDLVAKILEHMNTRNVASLSQASKALQAASKPNLRDRGVAVSGWSKLLHMAYVAIFQHRVFDVPLQAIAGRFKHDARFHAKAKITIGNKSYTIELLQYVTDPDREPIHAIHVSERNTNITVLRVIITGTHAVAYMKSSLHAHAKRAIRWSFQNAATVVEVAEP